MTITGPQKMEAQNDSLSKKREGTIVTKQMVERIDAETAAGFEWGEWQAEIKEKIAYIKHLLDDADPAVDLESLRDYREFMREAKVFVEVLFLAGIDLPYGHLAI
jgi:hypothetical protein